jgi:hypothetical protein
MRRIVRRTSTGTSCHLDGSHLTTDVIHPSKFHTMEFSKMATTEASVQTGSMGKRRLPQHWLLRLVTGLPVCCLLLTISADAFNLPISSRRQHVSVRSSWASSSGKQQWRAQSQVQNRQIIQRSDLSMNMRKMVRTWH